jgi:hypothetical protein
MSQRAVYGICMNDIVTALIIAVLVVLLIILIPNV